MPTDENRLTTKRFDYSSLPADIAAEARADAALIKQRWWRSAGDMFEIGKALIRQKAALPHGMFMPWIAAEVTMSYRQASRFMRAAEHFGESASLAYLRPEAVYALISADPDVRAEVERRGAAGEKVTAADVKGLGMATAAEAALVREFKEDERLYKDTRRLNRLVAPSMRRRITIERDALQTIELAIRDLPAEAQALPFIAATMEKVGTRLALVETALFQVAIDAVDANNAIAKKAPDEGSKRLPPDLRIV